MKGVMLKMREQEEREGEVKEIGKVLFRHDLCHKPYGNRIQFRKKEGWKRKEMMREMMGMMEEEDVKESLIISFLDRLSQQNKVSSFNYGFGISLRVK
jgi:hypothetical protein